MIECAVCTSLIDQNMILLDPTHRVILKIIFDVLNLLCSIMKCSKIIGIYHVLK